jgi:hypothetical protein
MHDGTLGGGTMKLSAEEIKAFECELSAWFEENDLQEGIKWSTAEEYYGEEQEQFPFHHYFVMYFEDSELYYVLNSYAAADSYSERVQSEAEEMHGEFEGILKRHGLWFEMINNVSISIMGKEKELDV